MTFGRKTSQPVAAAFRSNPLPLIAFSGMAILAVFTAIVLWPHPAPDVDAVIPASEISEPNTAVPFTPDLNPLLKYPNTSVEYYDVEADTPMQAVAYMHRHGPVDTNDNFRAQGITYWKVRWNYPRTQDSCDTSRVRVSLESRVLLPRLKSMDNWTDGHRQVWGRFMQALIAHEAEHVRLSSRHMFRVADAVKRSSCADAPEAAQIILEEIKAENARYDKETQHGAKHGVDMRTSR